MAIVKAAKKPKPVAQEPAPAPEPSGQGQNPDAPIYVRAIRTGHYDLTRHYAAGYDHPRAGFVFVLEARDGISKHGPRPVKVHVTAAEQFSESWMERVSDEEGRAAIEAQGRRIKKPAVIRKTAADRSVI